VTQIALIPETERTSEVEQLASQLRALGFDAATGPSPDAHPIRVTDWPDPNSDSGVAFVHRLTPLEQALACIPVEFEALPLLVEGESKVVRLWTERVLLQRFKPTVYSFTHNRYGVVPGTDAARLDCSAEIFRRLADEFGDDPDGPRSAFLSVVPAGGCALLAQRRVRACNLEVRVKRFHVGSPLHRYRFTERHETTQQCGPLVKWSRFDEPIVCFDWRHPLTDEEGQLLADEPVSDDYAAVWMDDVPRAKSVARRAFLWLEELFESVGLLLVDICFLIDRSGGVIHGEISPDCMRVRLDSGEPARADSLDKDVWREGRPEEDLRARYEEVLRRVQQATREEEAAWVR
jgi:phosphoribosylaminoimidazole-succinocarboxamide synthase